MLGKIYRDPSLVPKWNLHRCDLKATGNGYYPCAQPFAFITRRWLHLNKVSSERSLWRWPFVRDVCGEEAGSESDWRLPYGQLSSPMGDRRNFGAIWMFHVIARRR